MTVGAVLWPDEAAKRECNEVRRRLDPHFRLIDPHITVIFPFETDTRASTLGEKLAESIIDLSPFRVALGRLSTIHEQAEMYPEATALLSRYPNAKNAIFLIPEAGYNEILELKRRIGSAVNRVTSLVEYPPYLTLGQTLSDADYARALRQLAGYNPALQFAARSFDLLKETASGRWETLNRFMFPG